jgi:RHS repeat-associated protein
MPRGVTGLVLAVAVFGVAAGADAGTLTGTIGVGDGSKPPTGKWPNPDYPIYDPHPSRYMVLGEFAAFASIAYEHTFGNLLPLAGTAGWEASASTTDEQPGIFYAAGRVPGARYQFGNPAGVWVSIPYFLANHQATCVDDSCSPNFDARLYAKFGNVKGVVKLVDGSDLPFSLGLRATPAQTVAPEIAYAFTQQWAFTDAEGKYSFAQGRMLVPENPVEQQCAYPFNYACESIPIPPENEWGLRVLGDGGVNGDDPLGHSNSAGHFSWRISPTSKINVTVDVTSSTASIANFFLRLEDAFPPEDDPDHRPKACEPDDGRTSGLGNHPITERGPECVGGNCPMAGHPVSLITGNVLLDQTDLELPGVHYSLAFARSYNSLTSRSGVLGRGWNHGWEQALEVVSPQILRMRSATGAARYFSDPDRDGVFTPFGEPNGSNTIVQTVSGFASTHRNGWREEYDSAGRLVRLVDRLSRTTEIARDSFGRVERITSPEGRWLKLEYNIPAASGYRLTRLVSPEGTVAEYSYTLIANAELMLSQVRYVDGTGYRFTYNNDFLLLSVADLAGVVLDRHGYDADKRAAWSERHGGRERLTYSYEEGQTRVTNALGGVSVYEFEKKPSGTVVSRITGCTFCGSAVGPRTYEYDDEGRVTRMVDADGAETLYTYVGDNLTEVRNGLLRTTTYSGHDAFGRPTAITVPGFGTTSLAWANEGILSITPPAGPATTFAYTNGRLASVTSGGLTHSVVVNEKGEVVSTTDSRGNTSSYEYDSVGRLIGITRPGQPKIATRYDARGRPIAVKRPDGKERVLGYDTSGRLQRVTDEAGRTTRYAYDRYGSLEVVLDPLSGTTRFAYDLMLNLVSLTDARSQKTAFEYDSFGRLVKVTDPLGGAEQYTYTPGGRLQTRLDRRGILTTYSYDALGRPTGRTYSNGEPAVTITYDDDNRLMTISNGTDTLTLTFDAAGRLLSEASAFHGTNVSYSYDSDGLLETLSLGSTPVASYGYLGGVLSSLSFGSRTFQFTHDALLRRERLVYPNAIEASYSFDVLSRLTRLQAGPALDVSYTHDLAGNRLSKSLSGQTEDYGYDALDQLTSVTRPPGAPGSQTFAYDRVGNRVTEQRDGLGRALSFDARNRLLASAPGPLLVAGVTDESATVTVQGQPARALPGNTFEAQIPAASTFTVQATDASGNTRTTMYGITQPADMLSFTHDANGNLTSKTEGATTTTYEWNAENQLLRVTRSEGGAPGTELARFLYDPSGRRVEKVAGGKTYRYAYSGMDILRETVTDGSGTTTYRYIHGPGIDEPLARENVTAGTVEYYHADGLGSIVATTNQAGTIVSTRQYDAWGNLEIGASDPGYAFGGYHWDPEIGLYYVRARYLDPKLGRFISEDPIGFAGGLNLYAYAANRPTYYVDPFGLAPVGHHYVPRIVRGMPGLSTDAAAVFEATTTGPLDLPNLNQPGYNGPHRAYDQAVRNLFDDYIARTRIDPSKMTAAEASAFIDQVRSSRNPVIRSFLDDVEGAAARYAARARGLGRGLGRCLAVVGVITAIVDAIEYAEQESYCKKNPCACGDLKNCKI